MRWQTFIKWDFRWKRPRRHLSGNPKDIAANDFQNVLIGHTLAAPNRRQRGACWSRRGSVLGAIASIRVSGRGRRLAKGLPLDCVAAHGI